MPRDPELDSHFSLVRKAKVAMGVLFAVGGVVVAYRQIDGLTMEGVLVIIGLSIMGGMMMDAPGVTQLVSVIIKAIPWSRNGNGKPS